MNMAVTKVEGGRPATVRGTESTCHESELEFDAYFSLLGSLSESGVDQN
jgi:hypothetical protein